MSMPRKSGAEDVVRYTQETFLNNANHQAPTYQQSQAAELSNQLNLERSKG